MQNNYIYEKERECIKMGKAIIVKDLFVSYQGNQVVQNVSFEIEQGKLVGIIGPNGAENLL